MIRDRKPRPKLDEIEAWLIDRHGGPIEDLAPVSGGFWSAAFVYRSRGDDLVLRLSDAAEGFEIDRDALAFARPGLPVPEVIEIGQALGACYAISRRHFGRFLETAPEHEGPAIGRALDTLLAALRSVPAEPDARVIWYDPESTDIAWKDWLLAGLRDEGAGPNGGWRARLAERADADALFRACETRIAELLPACPERRDLVHSDLLHQNVLVAEDDPGRVSAVFSWKCSARGDFLYDVAWCTLWSPWHPAVAAADVWSRTLEAPDLHADDLRDAPLRHHCYELQIAASHLGWYVFTENDAELQRLGAEIRGILDRGPR